MSSVSRGYVWTGVKSASYSKLSVPGYTTIKYRKKSHVTDAEAMKEELRLREGKGGLTANTGKRLAPASELDAEPPSKKSKWEEDEPEEVEEEALNVEVHPLDKDDSEPEEDERAGGKESNSNEDGDDEDDDDEELAEIQRQLERIKKEKEEERLQKEREAAEAARMERESSMAAGNPLLMAQEDVSGRVVVKKWYEETIFKNQAQGEQQYRKRFINDTVRNDFHRRFLAKYVR